MAYFLGTAASLLLMISALQEKGSRDGNPVVKNPCFHCRGVQVRSLGGELRSHMPPGAASQKKREEGGVVLLDILALLKRSEKSIFSYEISRLFKTENLCGLNKTHMWAI